MISNVKQFGTIFDLAESPLIMGILNVTPDSFSDGGQYFQINDAIKHAEQLIKKGVNIIDIGGESTRPGAEPVSEEEELKRVIPVICELKKRFPNILISIDTYKSNVAKEALLAGANMINDVSGLTMDLNMATVAAKANCPIVIMHNRGIPATKPLTVDNRRGRSLTCPTNDNNKSVVKEIFAWLQTQSQYAIDNGIQKESIIIDPGIGFGKTPNENLLIIENLKDLKSLGYPILVGPSRKSFIRALFGENADIDQKTKELVDLSVHNGADIVRVH